MRMRPVPGVVPQLREMINLSGISGGRPAIVETPLESVVALPDPRLAPVRSDCARHALEGALDQFHRENARRIGRARHFDAPFGTRLKPTRRNRARRRPAAPGDGPGPSRPSARAPSFPADAPVAERWLDRERPEQQRRLLADARGSRTEPTISVPMRAV